MALVRELLIMTFDEDDTEHEKLFLLKAFEEKGYNRISEVTLTDTGKVKEWILQGPVKNGKIGAPVRPPVNATKEGKAKADLFNFRPQGKD